MDRFRLFEYISRLQDRRTPTSVKIARGRERLLAHMEQSQEEAMRQTSRPARLAFMRPIARFPVALAAGMLLVLVGIGSGVMGAAADALPGDTLYAVKRFSEKAELWVVRDPALEVVLQAALVERRLRETDVLLTQEESSDHIVYALDESRQHLQAAQDGLENLARSSSPETASIASALEAATAQHGEHIQRLARRAPSLVRSSMTAVELELLETEKRAALVGFTIARDSGSNGNAEDDAADSANNVPTVVHAPEKDPEHRSAPADDTPVIAVDEERKQHDDKHATANQPVASNNSGGGEDTVLPGSPEPRQQDGVVHKGADNSDKDAGQQATVQEAPVVEPLEGVTATVESDPQPDNVVTIAQRELQAKVRAKLQHAAEESDMLQEAIDRLQEIERDQDRDAVDAIVNGFNEASDWLDRAKDQMSKEEYTSAFVWVMDALKQFSEVESSVMSLVEEIEGIDKEPVEEGA